jgi:protein-L-isoaspartate(D-aspartate) O-methyltransferase
MDILQREGGEDRAAARQRMVERQLRARGIRDERVLAAMEKVPRERFLTPEMRRRAYEDRALPTDHGQTISQPYMVALMTEVLRVEPDHGVLEIGTGSGYQCAILAELGRCVWTVERIAALSERARGVLEALGYANVEYRVGDGTLGWPEAAPFDRIMVTAGAPRRPERLLEQLAEGGFLVAPVGDRYGQDLMVYEKLAAGAVREHSVCKCVFVPLVGDDGW